MRNLVLAGLGVAAMLAVAGCGSYAQANDYNLPDNMPNVVLHWKRIESPANYPTIVRACDGREGLYIDQDASNSVQVVPNDPACRS